MPFHGARRIRVSYYAGNGAWSTAIAYASGGDWLTVPGAGSSLPTTLTASFGLQPVGTYAATLSITATGGLAETRNLPISYSVQPLLQVPAIPELDVTNQQGADGQTRSVVVTTADPARNTAWMASVDADSSWLALTSAAGDTGGTSTLAMSLVPAEVAKLHNGRYVATVSVDPALAGIGTVEVPVVLNVDRTHVAAVAPYVAADNAEGDVFIRGMALTADGRELLIALNEDVAHLDPGTLVETRRTRIAAASSPNNTLASIARVDDGSVVIGLQGEMRSYRPWDRTDEQLLPIEIVGGVAANATGNKLLWVTTSNATSYRVIDSMDLTTSFIYSGVLNGVANLLTEASDRFGTRWAFTRLSNTSGTDITDGAGNLIDTIPGAANSNAMSSDGETLAIGFFDRVQFYDLSGTDPADLGSVPAPSNSLYNLHFTPHQDEIVSCGSGSIQAAAVP